MKPILFTYRQVRGELASMIAEACHAPTSGRAGVSARRAIALLFVTLLSLATITATGQDASIDWWSIDGGGEVHTEGGEWTLSGSFGQWDSTEGNTQSGGSWELTGGFWAVAAPASDLLFKDDYEQ